MINPQIDPTSSTPHKKVQVIRLAQSTFDKQLNNHLAIIDQISTDYPRQGFPTRFLKFSGMQVVSSLYTSSIR